MPAFDKEKMMRDMKKRAQERQDSLTKKSGGGGKFAYFDAPNGVSLWKPKEEKVHVIDILPYTIGKNGGTSQGDLDYTFLAHVHQNVGPENKRVVCPKKTFGSEHKCPICEEVSRLYEIGDKTSAKALQPKRRVLYNVIVRDGAAEEAKGVQIYEVSHFYVEQRLQDAAQMEDGGISVFMDPVDGQSIGILYGMSDNPGPNGKNYLEVKALSSKARKTQITDEELESVVALDETLRVHSYEEIAAMFRPAESVGEEAAA